MNSGDYITGAEFARWRTDFVAFRAELAVQIRDGFAGTHARLDEINGRTRKNSESVVELTTRLDKIDEDDSAIKNTVDAIQSKGCAQLKNHGEIVQVIRGDGEGTTPEGWSRRKKVAVSGGLIAGGAALWPVLAGILGAIHSLLDHLQGIAK